MKGKKKALSAAANGAWDEHECRALIAQLWALRQAMLEHEARLAPWLSGVAPGQRASARNLAHYLALRHSDRRPLQEGLVRLGVSSLGRAESHVLANLDKVLGILHRLVGEAWQARSPDEPAGLHGSRELLAEHTAALLGAPPPGRDVRIMVTLPGEAASDFDLVRRLVGSGLDIARINCAHDGPEAWTAMAAKVRRAAKGAERPVRILMDLGGPKLRTGTIAPGPAVLKLRPRRDACGRVLEAARLGLRPAGATLPVAGAAAQLGVDPAWLARLAVGERIRLVDARGRRRRLTVVHRDDDGALAEADRTIYFVAATRLERHGKGRPRRSAVHDLPESPGALQLVRGDRLRLTRGGIGQAADGAHRRAPAVPCTLPEIFGKVSVGERVRFDDGRIGGLIRRVHRDWLEVEITDAREGGDRLAGDKGINLPDSELDLPALTAKDIADLEVVAREADLVGLSFAQRGADVVALRQELARRGAGDLGIVLKIETRRGFDNLPELLYAAMAGQAAGVMIARGDLAVECGYERLAEVQEELLWAAEAAHMPVIWATQVLETLAKTGRPSRAEITDAAMGERAECVMLNKGPFIVDAMRTLDDILRRMQSHQTKKRPLLRALKSWSAPPKPGRGRARE